MFQLKRLALAVVLSCVSEGAIAQQAQTAAAPPTHTESWWNSKYGEADTIGAINNLSPRIVKEAARLVKTGKVYALGVPSGPDTPAYGARTITIERTPGPGSDFTPDGTQRVTAFDERITTSMGIGTQIDGLAHLGVDHHYYNGIEGKDLAGSYTLDIASIPPIVTRGVLIDMTKHYKKPMLEVGDMFNKAEIMAAAKAQKVTIRKGDVVLFHTNWIEKALTDKDLYRSREPGLGEEGAQYLADLGVVAVGADTIALEALPSPPGKTFIVHQTLLAKNGVYILESIDTRELAKDGAKEFLFVLGAPRIQGTVQMIINPVAIR
ncbi:cyclase family protein [Piscinibacter sp.]|uniref:cyclase family protein n=1 Tax=Piscinibacter sp. TaxID=1903157 RepID=UPI002BEA5DF9|nr:cyclase family protein [Albitalea sp.]HUG23651.1 cyclase family protein [Albitalea sp.]